MTRYPADYPGKRSLTEAEANRVLADGPDLKWFESGWAEHGVLLGDVSQRYGYIHVLPADEDDDQPRKYDIHLFDDRQGLAWALELLHDEHPECPSDDCLGLMYITPDEPIRLRLVIEEDDAGEDGTDEGASPLGAGIPDWWTYDELEDDEAES